MEKLDLSTTKTVTLRDARLYELKFGDNPTVYSFEDMDCKSLVLEEKNVTPEIKQLLGMKLKKVVLFTGNGTVKLESWERNGKPL